MFTHLKLFHYNLGQEITKMLTQQDALFQMMSKVQLDVEEIKERLNDLASKEIIANEPLPVQLPIRTLDELDLLNDYISTSETQKHNFVSNIFL